MFDQMLLHYPQQPMENKWRPRVETAPNCPRCASSNTKFCYYNNYSLSQPRYFCKGCRRYWTKGGSLRNVPVGGGCRKNRRSKHARSSQTAGGSSGYTNNPSYIGDDSPERANSIDLADVFAKFLNQSSDDQQNHDHINGDDSSSGNEVQNMMVVPPFMNEDDGIDEFMAQNTNLLELQDILNEELPQDFEPYWINGTASVSNFAWEQDFEELVCNNNNGGLNISSVEVSGELDPPSAGKLFQGF